MKQFPVEPSVAAPRAARSYRGETSEARQRQRRERLTEAALDAFAKHGYTATTMRDICAGARLTERYFYESFRNTEEVFEVLYKDMVAQLRTSMFEALAKAPQTVEGMAEAGLRAFYTFIQEDPRRARIMLVDAVRINLSSRLRAEAELGECVALMREKAPQLYPNLPDTIDPRLVAVGMLGMSIHMAMGWVRTGFKEPLEQILEHSMYAWRGLHAWLSASEAGATGSAGAKNQRASASGKARAAKPQVQAKTQTPARSQARASVPAKPRKGAKLA